jgi:hypothetical protein
MAKIKAQSAASFKPKAPKSRPGIHSKTQTSVLKSSKNYKKSYKGQGR